MFGQKSSRGIGNTARSAQGFTSSGLQFAHLYEALGIVDEIRRDSDLMRMIEQSDWQTHGSFDRLKPFLPDGSRRQWFHDMVGRIRHNVTFHYEESGRLIERAISDIASRDAGRFCPITRGDTAYIWYFQAGDEVSDNIVRRQIWKIGPDKDLQAETEEILSEIHQDVFLPFVDFAGALLWRFTNR